LTVGHFALWRYYANHALGLESVNLRGTKSAVESGHLHGWCGMKHTYGLLVLVASVLAGVADAQPTALQVEKRVVSKSTFGSNDTVGGSATCDASGNIYLRIIDPAKREGRPVLMFDRAGALKAKFTSPHLAKLISHGGFEGPFAVLPSGGIVTADYEYPNIYLVRFSAEGRYESEVILDPASFFPYQLAVFPSGELLLSGIENERRPHSVDRTFTAIYDKSGHLIKRLELEGDEEIDQAIELGDSRYARAPGQGNFAVSSGRVSVGEDGSVYLERSMSPAIVYVISSSGNVIRKLSVAPSTSGDVPFEMQLSKGKLAFVFDGWLGSRSSGNPSLAVVDATNGGKKEDLEAKDGIGLFGLACYESESDRFAFVGMSAAKHVQITTARKLVDK
jgi:hypothetical protein